jgi:hypothetical protein
MKRSSGVLRVDAPLSLTNKGEEGGEEDLVLVLSLGTLLSRGRFRGGWDEEEEAADLGTTSIG